MVFDLLGALFLLVLLGVLAALAVAAYLLLPLTDWFNEAMRRIGLAGPSPDSRATGVRAVGRVASPFVRRPGESRANGKIHVGGEIWDAECEPDLAGNLHEGDRVEVVYNDDLTVTVLPESRRTG